MCAYNKQDGAENGGHGRVSLDERLADVILFLKDVAEERYGSPDVKRLKIEYQDGRYCPGEFIENFLEELISLESTYLEKYKNLVYKLAMKRYRFVRDKCIHLSIDDFIQQANIGLLKAIWNYDGRDGNKFITFAYIVIGRELITFTNSNTEFLSGIASDIVRAKQKVCFLSQQNNIDFNEAVDIAVQEGMITRKEGDKIRKTVYTMSSISQVMGDCYLYCNFKEFEQYENIEVVAKILESDELDDWERDVLLAILDGKSIMEAFRDNMPINSKTGKPITRQALYIRVRKFLDRIKRYSIRKKVV